MNEGVCNQSNNSTDQVIQPTPVASRVIRDLHNTHSSTPTKGSTYNEPMHEGNSVSNSNNNLGTDNILGKKEPQEQEIEYETNYNDIRITTTPLKGKNTHEVNAEVMFNTRTPDLDRIAKFFKKNRSPTKKNLASKFNNDELDTPPLKRTIALNKSSLTESDKTKLHEDVTDFSMGSAAEGPYHVTATQKDTSKNNEIDLTGSFIVNEENDGNELMTKFNYSEPDTPESQRIRPEVHDGINEFPLSPKLLTGDNLTNLNEVNMEKDDNNKSIIVSNQDDNRHLLETVPILDNIIDQKQSLESENNTSNFLASIPNTISGGSLNMRDTFTKISLHRNEGSNLLGKDSHISQEENEEDNTISKTNLSIDDTTDGNISNQWIFRPNVMGSNIFQRSDSTQLINQSKTQEIKLQSNNEIATQLIKDGSTQLHISQASAPDVETQLIESQIVLSPNNSLKYEDELKIINSFEPSSQTTRHNTQPTVPAAPQFDTPINMRANIEAILEVPETSSPSKIAPDLNPDDGIENSTSSPSPGDKRPNSRDRVFLKVSSKPNLNPDSDMGLLDENSINNSDTLNARTENIIMSDAEMSQELSEVDLEESQGIIVGRRKRKRNLETVELSQNDESRSSAPSPKKKMLYKFPTEIKDSDKMSLTMNDILFNSAVWCQYDLDFKFYPAILLSGEADSDTSQVFFESGEREMKNEDIYYLDIRIGDTVNVGHNKFLVVALECREHDMNIIRCIRGYDTVHLKKKNANSTLSDEISVMSLAYVSLDLDEWVKRPNIIVDEENGEIPSKDRAYGMLRHSLRGRKNTKIISPRKGTPINFKEDSDSEPDNSNDKDYDDGVESFIKNEHNSNKSSPFTAEKDTLNKLKLGTVDKKDASEKIFDKCLFVLTKFSEGEDDIYEIIKSEGGEVIDLGFPSLFKYSEEELNPICDLKEFNLGLRWTNSSKSREYKFACLIAKKYSRSLKYLETLALGWPTLQWKFIHECVRCNKLMPDIIPKFLLPSGESLRLRLDDSSDEGVIKSNNIYNFYSNFLLGRKLGNQINLTDDRMKDYIVISCGNSKLTDFVKFVFACMGVRKLFEIDIIEHLMNSFNSVEKIIKYCQENNLKIVFYLNMLKDNIDVIRLLGKVRDELSTKLDDSKTTYHVESKEWLIQTIINESTGFTE